MRKSLMVLALVVAGCGGVNPGMMAEPVEVTGTIQAGDKSLDGFKINFEPTEAGMTSVAKIEKGSFTAKLVPGKYAWLIAEPSDQKLAKAYEAIPVAYRTATLERQIDARAGATLDLKVD